MKALLAMFLLAGAPQDAPTAARSVPASPLLGSWAVDVTRLPIPPEARPKRVTFTFRHAGGGKWRTNVDIIGNDGSESHASSTYTPDGTSVPVEGSPEADIAAVRLPAPDVMVLALGKGGIPASTRVYTVAADGRNMTETAVYFGEDGKPIMRTNYFTRVR